MTQLKTLIFDVDGTLADTERYGHRVAFNQAFAEAGLDWHWSEELYAELLAVTGGKERIRFFIERQAPPLPEMLGKPNLSDPNQPSTTDPNSDPNSAIPLDEWIATLHRAKNRHYGQLIRAGKIPPRSGVVRLIREAHEAGLRLAIATTSAPDNAIALIETILAPKGASWFEFIAAGDIVAHKKPAPDIYQYVLREMHLDPRECLVLEDSEHGLQAATQAGLATVITYNSYTRDQNFSEAAMVLDHLGDADNPVDLATQSNIELLAKIPPTVPQNYVTVPLLQAYHQYKSS
ncbi:MAG: HAD family hydrolase [Elainellaceae cyanobacterium]